MYVHVRTYVGSQRCPTLRAPKHTHTHTHTYTHAIRARHTRRGVIRLKMSRACVGTYSCSGLVPLFSFFSGVPDGKARKNMQVLSLLNCGCTGRARAGLPSCRVRGGKREQADTRYCCGRSAAQLERAFFCERGRGIGREKRPGRVCMGHHFSPSMHAWAMCVCVWK